MPILSKHLLNAPWLGLVVVGATGDGEEEGALAVVVGVRVDELRERARLELGGT